MHACPCNKHSAHGYAHAGDQLFVCIWRRAASRVLLAVSTSPAGRYCCGVSGLHAVAVSVWHGSSPANPICLLAPCMWCPTLQVCTNAETARVLLPQLAARLKVL